MNPAEEKAALRQRISGLPLPDWQPLLDAFLDLPELKAAQTVMLFYGVGREPDTTELIETLWAQGKTVLLPKCLPERRMEARQILPGARLVYSAYAIPEPDGECPAVLRDTIDLILVPNLCCDRRGYRLGHGGGYYDRYLAGYSGMTVALCPVQWLQKELPRDEFDLPVQLVLTERGEWRAAEAPRHLPDEPQSV